MPLLIWYLSLSLAYLLHIVRAEEVDFSFVQRWAAIGDSFTAGIGSGNQLGNLITLDETWKCSRFSYSYPQIVNQALGSSVKDFHYLACSGDRTDGIEKQAKALKGELDLVVLTAGGNDLCLAGMIKECVFLPHSEKSCDEVLDKAQSNINNILKPNIRKVLDALEDKMRKDSIVIYNGYAPFFNTDNEDCATKQSWALLEWDWTSFWNTRVLPLTIERRKRFNALVNDINKAISEVVAEYDGKKKYRIAYSDWSEWPEIVDGQMCSPSDDTGKYPNSKQPTMQFIKPDTHLVTEHVHDEFKRRQANISAESPDKIAPPIADVYDSILYKSPYPPVVALDHLESRDTLAPNCPGDGLPGVPFGLGLPDSFLSNFHPNQNGHETIAASTLETIAWMRAKILGKESCPVTKQDEFKCWSSDGLDWPRPYAGWERLDKSYKEFCESVQPPSNTVNWEKEEDYFTGTMEEHRYKIKLSDGAAQFSKNECLDSFKKLIFSCDTDTDSNPMSWKYGGRYVRGATTYELNPKWERPTHKRADGMCSYKNRYLYYEYRITGKGWAGYDWGKETLLAALKGCKALTPTAFEFGYCSPIGQECFDGYDWYAAFRTTIGVNGRCMDNQNVVAKSAGGHFHKYQKDGESYDDVGCSEQ
ncbi:SGNH hydrolase-type esterase domain-containing protein [Colletotrichum cereale]|nr:SGNH hydrolase-type esterase domain-containing protein [Colletotrichum cereale]